MSLLRKALKVSPERTRGMLIIVDDQPVERLGMAKTQLNSAGEVTRPYECMSWNLDNGTVTDSIEWLTDAEIEKARSAFTWSH